MLVEWENWNPATYFLFNEKGIMATTTYDREMDALHPSQLDQEMLLTRKNGTPIGLVRLRPDRFPGVAQAWLYLHDEADYSADDIRRGFRALMKEAGNQQSLRRLTVPVAEEEKGLQDFLEAMGFKREGTFREALFYFDKYHDVHSYAISTDAL